MQEELNFIYDVAKEQMSNAIKHFDSELVKIRAGRANPNILDGVKVDYYGTRTPIKQVSNLMVSDARTLTIQPWEKGMLEVIEKAIINANLGLNPQNNGEKILISIPALTEERRRELVKQVLQESEQARIAIRSARQKANEEIKGLQKNGLSEDLTRDGESSVQKITDTFVKTIDDRQKNKEEEIMTI